MTAVYIHAPPGFYLAQRHFVGARTWSAIGGRRRSKSSAFAEAGRALACYSVNRVRVIWCSDWYEPNVVMEAARP